jgi:hypothetical protein
MANCECHNQMVDRKVGNLEKNLEIWGIRGRWREREVYEDIWGKNLEIWGIWYEVNKHHRTTILVTLFGIFFLATIHDLLWQDLINISQFYWFKSCHFFPMSEADVTRQNEEFPWENWYFTMADTLIGHDMIWWFEPNYFVSFVNHGGLTNKNEGIKPGDNDRQLTYNII